ncbi:dipeptide epimerase [Xinfangfangia sp. CPCC 101601]|uniref:Dipeptide epimerase n=1 Tax=Pseudogemmobacter lacusdianii TaxID=3069608 RepID=A0ABU0W1W4_9RHOB|nr:dipeptide epimerase [Xinfangfangia sp. CPCC 101601]MDQ2067883.1 dipeptide epimerase [Xinfangfangia sp. CPCC 101601]
MIRFDFSIDKWPLKQPFRFAGFTVTDLDCVHVRLSRNGVQAQGEGVLPVVFDVTIEAVTAQLDGLTKALAQGTPIEALCGALPPGPARNALDCALWDLRAKESGTDIWQLAGLPAAADQLEVDETIGLGTPDDMARAAKASAHRVLKVKLDAENIIDRVRAIRSARPDAELIVDANQSWTLDLLRRHGADLAVLDVKMIEQPLPRGQDAQLRGLDCPVPIFADESCHTAADVPQLIGLYQGVNIKLDKTGGLTEALALVHAARAAGMGVMVGCMAGTSLSMAPAYVIAGLSDWSDLDGPLLLAQDRPPAMTYAAGQLTRCAPALWG